MICSAPMPDLRERLCAALARPARASSDFDLTGAVPDGFEARAAGVLAGFLPDGRLILTRRASGLRHHGGQIALPGGKVDPGDADATAAALRESHEEIGLPPAQVEVLGTLPTHHTVTGYAIAPVLGLIHPPFSPVAEAGEVDEIFTVPFDHIANPAHYRLEGRRWLGQWRSYHVAPYGPYYIWGATARILLALAQRLTP